MRWTFEKVRAPDITLGTACNGESLIAMGR
jgi:hypothetical protein